MDKGNANYQGTRNTFAQAETGARLPKTAEDVVNLYASSDFNQRMSLWLDHRDLRRAFDLIEQAALGRSDNPQGRLRWLCLGRKKPFSTKKRHNAA